MKQTTSPLKALLESNLPYSMADLFAFSFLNQETLYMTSFDRPIEDDYKTYIPAIIERSHTKTIIGVEVDTLNLTIYARPKDMVSQTPMIAAAFKGLLDGAYLTLKRAFLADGNRFAVGTIHLFSGRVSDISGSSTTLKMAVKSDFELLNVKVPRNIYQASCLNTLYDATCKASPVWQDGRVETVGRNYIVTQFGGQYPQGTFNNGIMTFKEGKNKGVSRAIKRFVDQRDTMSPPAGMAVESLKEFHFLQSFPHPIQGSDQFQVCAGCDKTQATCQARFGNLHNFRGFPFIPEPETAR